jgi:ABC-type multidrug transport system fused ATPase/permease subunit
VAGIACGSERDCPEGSSSSGNSGVVIAAVFIFFALFGIYSIKYFIEAKVREAQRGAINKEKEISDGAVHRMTVVGDAPPDFNSKKSLSIGDDTDVEDKKDMPGVSKKNAEGYKISFEGVGLVLKTGVKIMSNVSGEFLPTRTCAIMGPSGAGKVSELCYVVFYCVLLC